MQACARPAQQSTAQVAPLTRTRHAALADLWRERFAYTVLYDARTCTDDVESQAMSRMLSPWSRAPSGSDADVERILQADGAVRRERAVLAATAFPACARWPGPRRHGPCSGSQPQTEGPRSARPWRGGAATAATRSGGRLAGRVVIRSEGPAGDRSGMGGCSPPPALPPPCPPPSVGPSLLVQHIRPALDAAIGPPH